MTRGKKTVTWTPVDASRLPDWTSEGVALIADLERREFLGQLEERLRIRREGGYAGIDVFVFLLYFFSSRLGIGLKTWWGRAREYKVALAALAGRHARQRTPSSPRPRGFGPARQSMSPASRSVRSRR